MIEIQSASLISQIAERIVAPQLKNSETYKKEIWKSLGLSDRLTTEKFLENTYAVHYRNLLTQMLKKGTVSTNKSKVVLQDTQQFLTELATFTISSLVLNVSEFDRPEGHPLRYKDKNEKNDGKETSNKFKFKYTPNKFELNVNNNRQLIVVPYPAPSEEEKLINQLELDYSYNKGYEISTPQTSPSPKEHKDEPNFLDKILCNNELPMETKVTPTTAATVTATTILEGDLSISSAPNSDSDETTKQPEIIQKKIYTKKKPHKENLLPTYEKPPTFKKQSESEQKKSHKKRKPENSNQTSKEKITGKKIKPTQTRHSCSESDGEEQEVIPDMRGNGAYEFMKHVSDCEKKNEMLTNDELFLRAQRQVVNSSSYYAEWLLKAQNMLLALPFKIVNGQPILECRCCPIHCTDDSDLIPPRGRPQNGGVYQEVQKQQKKREKQSKQ